MRTSVVSGWVLAFAVGACRERALAPGEGFVQVPGGRVWYRIVGSGPRIDRFVDELARVRRALDLRDVHLYGHSWGTMLAVEYMLTRPAGVHGLILAGPALSIPRYLRDRGSLRATLPESVRTVIARHERAGACDAPAYQVAMFEYYKRYFALRQPWSADLDSAVRQMDPSSSNVMFGPCSFSVAAALASYDRTDRVGEITVPTLFIIGRHDDATPGTARAYQRLVPGSELVIIENTGHLPMQDEPERYVEVLRAFLRRADGR